MGARENGYGGHAVEKVTGKAAPSSLALCFLAVAW